MTYSTPERAAERAIAHRLRAKVYRMGGCGACQHRLTNWGGCQQDRTFPRCLSTPGTHFEPDHERLKGA
jgi:hypothetical protein